MLTEISSSAEYDSAIERLKEILQHATLSPEEETELMLLVKQIQVYEKSLVEILDQIDDIRHSEGC